MRWGSSDHCVGVGTTLSVSEWVSKCVGGREVVFTIMNATATTCHNTVPRPGNH